MRIELALPADTDPSAVLEAMQEWLIEWHERETDRVITGRAAELIRNSVSVELIRSEVTP